MTSRIGNLVARMRGFARAPMRGFARAKGGNVAMIFALSLLPLTIAAGVGLDFTRAMLVRQQISEAVDAAALAVGSSHSADLAAAQKVADKYFKMNYTIDPIYFGDATVTVDSFDPKGTIQLSATATMPTILMKIVGIPSVPVSSDATVVWGQTKLWVALALDNSGSMAQGDASGSKMDALQNASHQLLTILQNAATTDGDVKVSIVPFTRSVNVGASAFGSSSAIDWGEWDAPPEEPGGTYLVAGVPNADKYAVPNVIDDTPSTIVFAAWGPGDSCPFTNASSRQMSPFGFYCMPNGTNQSNGNNIDNIPSSGTYKGYICPGIDSGNYNTVHNDRYYNGCYTSTKGTGTITVSKGSSAVCRLSNGVGFAAANCSCSGSGSTRTCSTQRWVHAWVPNSHSSWSGCVMDRQRSGLQTMTTLGPRTAAAIDYVTSNTAPSGSVPDTGFPAENPASCLGATVTTLGYNWTNLGSQIDAMSPGGSTNQAIGVAHGWQTLTNSTPYSPGTLPANTARYIILLSDGLNTQDRWWGDGGTEGTTEDGYIDDHEETTCDAAKADGVVIYSIFLDIGGAHGNSAPLQHCATDSSKYFDLTSTSGVVTTFTQIAQQITNVRVSK